MREQAPCECGHDNGNHVLIATSPDATGERPDPAAGGIRLCHVIGCECYRTWSIRGGTVKYVPDHAETAEIRESIQSGQVAVPDE